MSNQSEQQPTIRKRAFKRRTMQTAPCCWCGQPTECIHRTSTLKCWDCRMKMIKDYQYQHRAMQANNFNQ
jgi:hypothetical protein